MLNFTLPNQITDGYLNSGILAIGECHGIKEHYEFYNKVLEQLPNKPNLAVEFSNLDALEFGKFLNGEEVDASKISLDGRVNKEYFIFLKNYLEKNPQTKLIYLDGYENFNENLTRDAQMAAHFLKTYEKPVVIIAGNIHTQKRIRTYRETTIKGMGCFIKEMAGDFPIINIRAASGAFYNGGIKTITPDNYEDKIGKFTDLGDNEFDFYLEKATPTTIFSNL